MGPAGRPTRKGARPWPGGSEFRSTPCGSAPAVSAPPSNAACPKNCAARRAAEMDSPFDQLHTGSSRTEYMVRYLLGELEESDAAGFEDRFLSDAELFGEMSA